MMKFKALSPILVGLGLGVLISKTLVCKVTVDGVSMLPTYYSGDTLLVEKLSKVNRGDIITFHNNGKAFIKRVVAVPGDTVKIVDSSLIVNGEKVDEPYVTTTMYSGGMIEDRELLLSDREYFVLGDNRSSSIDSRNFGVIHEDDILGVRLIDLKRS